MGHYVEGMVSVIVPVYNRADLVGKAIESILAQTYDNIEILVINDGSTDHSLQVIESYANQFPGKCIVIDQQNSGQVHARNIGIEKSRGEFIAFLDSDDTWEKQKLSLQVPLFKGNVGLVYCGIHEVDNDGSCLKTVLCYPEMRGNIYRKMLIENRMTGGSVVVSRQALDQVGCFDESFKAAENWDLWIRVASKFSVDYVNQPLVNYHRHSGNMSRDGEKMQMATCAILQKHLAPLAGNADFKKTYDQAYANYYYKSGVMAFTRGEYGAAAQAFIRCWRHKLFYRDSLIRMFRILLGGKINRSLSLIKNKALVQYGR